MPFEKHYDAHPAASTPPCVHLRSKAMYVTGELRNPEHPDEVGGQGCWCNITQHVIGPDQLHVNRYECINGRECFRETR